MAEVINKPEGTEEEKRSPLLLIILIAAAVVAQWLFFYYQEYPLDFPWGKVTYTVNSEELNLLPNEEQNYLGTRLSQDDATEYVYRANSKYMTAAAAFSIRTGPGVYYQSIGRMYYGREVHVIATCEDNDWYMIDFYGEQAYVHSACLFDKLPELVPLNNDHSNTDGTRSEEAMGTFEGGTETDVTGQTVADTAETDQAEPVQQTDATTAAPTPTSAPTATPAPTAPPAVVTPTDPVMLELFELLNEQRTAQGLQPLSYSNALASAAAVRAQEIAVSFSHTRPDGSDWWTVNPDIMYGENLASGQSTAIEVFNSWWASPGHHDNMMNSGYRTVGFALYYGGDAGSTYYWVQEFGY